MNTTCLLGAKEEITENNNPGRVILNTAGGQEETRCHTLSTIHVPQGLLTTSCQILTSYTYLENYFI